jgi:hypothetical protein
MTRARLALLAYVALDFANPLMPGAVSFDLSASIEGVHGHRLRADGSVTPVAAAPRPLALAIDRPARPRLPETTPAVGREPISPPRFRAPSTEPPPPSEDH